MPLRKSKNSRSSTLLEGAAMTIAGQTVAWNTWPRRTQLRLRQVFCRSGEDGTSHTERNFGRQKGHRPLVQLHGGLRAKYPLVGDRRGTVL